jgi:GT2 family glycosyltransferase
MAPNLVNVILVSWNAASFVDVVFPPLLRQTHTAIEILLVDNGSSDNTLDLVREKYPGVRTFALTRNTGFSHALNFGIAQTSGEFVLSLNLDVVLETEFVASLVGALRDRPDVGWASGYLRRLTDAGPIDEIDCAGHYLLPSRYVYGYDPDAPGTAHYESPREVFGASGCAALYRRAMLEDLALGGEIFDEDFFAYFEDVDLDWRAHRFGYKCLFVPSARGAHARGGNMTSPRVDVSVLLASNRILTIVKNDDIGDILRDFPPILRRTLMDIALQWRHAPRAMPQTLLRVVRLLPRMFAKRRRLRRGARPGTSPVRQFRLSTHFLG